MRLTMNPDDFEQQLQRQSLRQPPAAWREEILAAARANIRPARSATESDWLVGWRAFLARIPLAWGAVAAVWAVIIGANLLMAGPSIAATHLMAIISRLTPQDTGKVFDWQGKVIPE